MKNKEQLALNKKIAIQEIIDKKRAKTYLEIGIYTGKCFLDIKAPKKIAIDPKLIISGRKKIRYCFKNRTNIFNEYYKMTSDDFFKMEPKVLTKKRLDVVLIDGLHTYEQSLKDVLNSLKYLKEDGVIIIHDCNPPNETIGFPAKSIKHVGSLNLPGWTGLWTGDVWKTIVYLRSIHRDLNVFVLNCDMGVAIITKRKPENMLEYTLEDIENLSYKDLERSRERLLNLKNPQYFKEFIKSL